MTSGGEFVCSRRRSSNLELYFPRAVLHGLVTRTLAISLKALVVCSWPFCPILVAFIPLDGYAGLRVVRYVLAGADREIG